jgi:phage terminase large subunit GpA-like protein
MDAVNDPTIREIVVKKSAQVGWTEILGNVVGYYVDRDPSPILLIQPTLEMAEAWSKDRLAPMVRDTPALNGKIKDARVSGSNNTLLHKQFPGGHITIAGANSPSGLASRPIRIVLCDEVDRYPASAGSEGDPVTLARKRSTTFWNRKILIGSTPTISGLSRIDAAFSDSDQRFYLVPCPHCSTSHKLEWRHVIFDAEKPEQAVMACPECGGVIENRHKLSMLEAGVWTATKDSVGIAGFHISELYSPWRTFGDVVVDFLASKNYPEKLKTWVNTSLGEVWEDREGDKVDADTLEARRQSWSERQLPSDVILVTAGVDTQDDRLECTRVAWLSERRSRVISHHIISGSPGEPDTWAQLDALLLSPMATEDGRELMISAACVDAGGHHAAAVLEFCEIKRARKIWAIRGRGGPYPIWPKKYSRSQKHRGKQQWMIGVDTAKDWIRSAFAVESETMPHHVAFSSHPSLDAQYFKQLTTERRVVVHDRLGRPRRLWKAAAGARVEAWDCLVYALTALEGLREMWKVKLHPRDAAHIPIPRPVAPAPAVNPALNLQVERATQPRQNINPMLGSGSWGRRL